MSSNSTSTNLSTENVITLVGMGISLCTSFIAFLTTIFTCTYMVLKSSFKDKQSTDIEILTKTKEREAKLKISMFNHESYTLDTKKFDNKKEEVSIKKGENNKKGNLVSENNDLNEVLRNNNKGDEMNTLARNNATTNAFNLFFKLDQLFNLGNKNNKNNKDILDVSSIRFVKQEEAVRKTEDPHIKEDPIIDLRKESKVVKIEVLGGNSENGFGDDSGNEG